MMITIEESFGIIQKLLVVIKSSGGPAADEAVRQRLEAKRQARPEALHYGFYKGRPVNSIKFTLPIALIGE